MFAVGGAEVELFRADGAEDEEVLGDFSAEVTGSEAAGDGGSATCGCGMEVEDDESAVVPMSEADGAGDAGTGWVVSAGSDGGDGGVGIAVVAVGV
jgi:hypothetical protein